MKITVCAPLGEHNLIFPVAITLQEDTASFTVNTMASLAVQFGRIC